MIKPAKKILLLIIFFSTFFFSETWAKQSTFTLQDLVDSADYYVYIDHDTFSQYTQWLLEQATDKDKYYEAVGNRYQGFYYYRNLQFDSSLFYLQKAEEIALAIKDDSLLTGIYWTKSNAYLDNFDYYLAIETTKKMLLHAKGAGFKQTQLGSYHQLGRIYLSCQLYDEALKYFELCKPPEDSRNSEFPRHQWWYLRVGQLYIEKEEYTIAEKYLEEALIRGQIHENKILEGDSYSTLASIYKERGSETCVENYKEAIEILIPLDEKFKMVQAYTGLAQYYENQKKKELAAQYYKQSFLLGVDTDLQDKLIPTLDFFINNPSLQNLISISSSELFQLRINAAEKASEKSNIDGLRRAEAIEKVNEAILNESFALEKSDLYGRIIFLTIILIISTIFFLYFLFRQNRKLQKSQEKINKQYALIKNQAMSLTDVNEKLKVNNSILEKDLSINSLELGHSKKLIQNIQKAANIKENQKIESILRAKVDDGYFNEIKYVNQFINQEFINQLFKAYPKLSFKEIELCCLLKKGLTSKEIASLTLKSIPSIKVARSRIRKKLNIPKSTDISLFLNNFDLTYKTT